jgi:hypothetical protein
MEFENYILTNNFVGKHPLNVKFAPILFDDHYNTMLKQGYVDIHKSI